MKSNIDKMEAGREAHFIDASVRPFISEVVNDIVNSLVANYRGDVLTHDMMVGKIAEMSALYGLLSRLESAQRQGDAAAEKEIGSAKAG